MTAKEFLEKAVLAERRVNAASRKVELYKSMAEKVTSSIGGEQVTHTRDVTANENAIIRLAEARSKVQRLEVEYQAIVDETIDTLILLGNQDYEHILHDYYLEHLSFLEISKKLHMSRSTVYIHHDEAIQELDRLLGKSRDGIGQNRTLSDEIGRNRT